MADMVDQLGSIIRFHRKESGLTLEGLARLAEVGKTVIFDVEKGKKSVRLTTLIAILKALNIELSLKSPLMNRWEQTRHAQR